MNKNQKILYRKEIVYNNSGQLIVKTRFILKPTINFYRLVSQRGL